MPDNQHNADLHQIESLVPGFTPETLNVQPELSHAAQPEHSWQMGKLSVQTHLGRDAFWVVVRHLGKGGVALRTFPMLGAYSLESAQHDDDGGVWRIKTHSGPVEIQLRLLPNNVLSMTSRLTPTRDLLVAFWPRDLYPLDPNDDPTNAQGRMEAGQRGLNGGYCYFRLKEPCLTNVLYVQNLTALNDFFLATKTRPDGVIGGEWPELGYLPPAAPNGYSPPINPLKAGTTYTLSDARLAFREDCDPDEFEGMRLFVDMLADIYPHLDKPQTQIRDWYWRAGQTLSDLKTSPDVMVTALGHKYIHPYTASEYPDSMVQMSVLSTLREFEKIYGFKDPLSDELAAGMRNFFDAELGSLRRYLPDVGVDKNKDAVDSWYLYHPLMNLARLAINGEDWARQLFFDGLEFVIKAAQHFNYIFPIIYDLKDFSVICQARGEEDLGQTDAGGLYAYVMLQAHQLTGERRYVEEAKLALKAMEGLGFELAYQTNLTAWGATACLKLWRLEGDEHYLKQSFVFIATLLHNCEMWHSDLGFAKSYANFLGVTCLHDGPYMAAYEAFECFAAFDEYLQVGADDLPASVRLLLSEYWRNALDVLWSFYPDALPEDALAKTVRNGFIDRNLSFPLEDIYGDGGPAGRVGQEIYGAGSAFVVASRAYAECHRTPFRLFAEYPMKTECTDNGLKVRIFGPPGYPVRLRVITRDGAPRNYTFRPDGAAQPLVREPVSPGTDEFQATADAHYLLQWNPS